MVAILGSIIPAPLTIPATRRPLCSTAISLGLVSVVIMARSAARLAAPSLRKFADASWKRLWIWPRSRYRPMTPVDATPILASSVSKKPASSLAIALASSRPLGPV